MHHSPAARVDDRSRPRPFLKWAGGKTQLLPELHKHLPRPFRRYFEPFLGGGAVFFSMCPSRAVLADVNPDLVGTYRAIQDDCEGVIAALREHEASEEHYYAVRAQQASGMSLVEGAARTIFLNRTCYNGLYRVNKKGQFNVPFGRYDNPTLCDPDNLRAVSLALQRAEIVNSDVFTTVARAEKGDLVYFDPPYAPVSKTASFTSYAKDGFGEEAQERLADTFGQLAARGVSVVLSNSDTPLIRKLYKGFTIHTVHARRAINSRADRRGPVTEVIVTA
jgi:DNA adenine methylase